MNLLRTLRIRDLVIIDDLTVEFAEGLNLLTGETGAGKSILVDALGLISGARADRAAVRAGRSKAIVEALFEVQPGSAAAEWMERLDAEAVDSGQILVRREIAAEGSGRISINGSPCTLGMLRELTDRLLESHGQHDPRSLRDSGRHTELLDGFGRYPAELERVRLAHAAVREASARLSELDERAARREGQLEALQRTVRELEELAPRPGELDELDRERHLLRNAGRAAALLDEVVGLTYEGEPSAAALTAASASRADELAELDPSLGETARRLRAAALEIEDAGAGLRAYRDAAEFDPARLERLEERRAALERACLAFATGEAGLLERGEAAAAELATLGALDEELAAARVDLDAAGESYASAAASLTRNRRAAAKKLASAVKRQFGALALAKAGFEVELIEVGSPGPRGAESAEFRFAANPGEPMRALRLVASGGELSRVMLALHVVTEGADRGRVVVFDEIDTGVGGAVADAVGARLQRLARTHQLLCVTHLPQVAAYADLHFRVRKRVASGRTRAGIAALSAGERVEELARMLGGREATTASRRHATELLDAAGRSARSQP
jgi:DNA repair protein RecN (Recombination protein N)